jgi:hypothetical protein
MRILAILVLAFGLMVCLPKVSDAVPMGTAFTYQGQLVDNNVPAEGLYDFQFALYDDPSTGTLVGGPVNEPDLDVIAGLFTVELDFGDIFPGDERWLEVRVRDGLLDDPNLYTALSPRQLVTATPYALYAKDASNADKLDGYHYTSFVRTIQDYGRSGVAANLHEGTTALVNKYLGKTAKAADSDRLDGLDSSSFVLTTQDYGRSGVSANLYEGTAALVNKYLGKTATAANSDLLDGQHGSYYRNWNNLTNVPEGFADGIDNVGGGLTLPYSGSTSSSGSAFFVRNVEGSTGRGISGVGDGTTGTGVFGIAYGSSGYGVYGSAEGSSGHGVYGSATATGNVTNYGGYFTAAGGYGRGVYARHIPSGNYGRIATTWEGMFAYSAGATGVVGRSNTGKGVSGQATGTGDIHNRGGDFEAAGNNAYGVSGKATGNYGIAVYGLANNTGNYTNYGGYFIADGSYGRGIWARGGPSGYAAEFRGNVIIKNRAGTTTVMELGEGLDYAEGFDVSYKNQICPGSVLIIDADNPGKLTLSAKAYDHKVAGIVAGAKDQGSGVRLGAGQFDYDVALAGRVYCNVDATQAGVQPGDLLTTSATAGYAMKATDYMRAQGAILGKAMEKLKKGKRGQILVLVTLQ